MALALLIIFVGVTALTAGAIGAAVASGTTIGVIVALFAHMLGTVIVLGDDVRGARPRRRRLTSADPYRWRLFRRAAHSRTIQAPNTPAIRNQTTKKSASIVRA